MKYKILSPVTGKTTVISSVVMFTEQQPHLKRCHLQKEKNFPSFLFKWTPIGKGGKNIPDSVFLPVYPFFISLGYCYLMKQEAKQKANISQMRFALKEKPVSFKEIGDTLKVRSCKKCFQLRTTLKREFCFLVSIFCLC